MHSSELEQRLRRAREEQAYLSAARADHVLEAEGAPRHRETPLRRARDEEDGVSPARGGLDGGRPRVKEVLGSGGWGGGGSAAGGVDSVEGGVEWREGASDPDLSVDPGLEASSSPIHPGGASRGGRAEGWWNFESASSSPTGSRRGWGERVGGVEEDAGGRVAPAEGVRGRSTESPQRGRGGGGGGGGDVSGDLIIEEMLTV